MTVLRAAICDDSMISCATPGPRLLREAGPTVVATAEDGESLVRVVVTNPDLDAVRGRHPQLPPTETDEESPSCGGCAWSTPGWPPWAPSVHL